jgi:hypothetical protein
VPVAPAGNRTLVLLLYSCCNNWTIPRQNYLPTVLYLERRNIEDVERHIGSGKGTWRFKNWYIMEYRQDSLPKLLPIPKSEWHLWPLYRVRWWTIFLAWGICNKSVYVISVKRSYPCNRPWRPIGMWDVEDSTLSRQSADRWLLSALRAEHALFATIISVRDWVNPRDMMRLEELGELF